MDNRLSIENGAEREFPFPPTTALSSQAPRESALPNKPSPSGPIHSTMGVAAPEAMEVPSQASFQRPSLPSKSLTERPAPAARQSRFRVKRGETHYVPTALNSAAWRAESAEFDSDSSSSSSSDEEMTVRPKKKEKSNNGSKGGRRSGSNQFSRFAVGNDNFKTKGRVSRASGRLNISVNETAHRGYLIKALGATLQQHLKTSPHQGEDAEGSQAGLASAGVKEVAVKRPDRFATRLSTLQDVPMVSQSIPKLNVVIMVIGSRGDIQPFLKLGKILKEESGHRVRIATHPAFKEFVERDSELEFFSVGGNPAELMAFMVKNPGLIPSVSTVKAGEIGKKRDSMYEMFQGFWRACINATDDENDVSNRKMMDDKHPFVADAIIANPPSFAHIHCAERLGIPLHLMFTFPYSPTQQFPHPLANIKKSNVDTNYANFISYPLVEMMTWQGLGDLVNRFRVNTLGLEPVSTLWAPGQLFRLKVPYTYLWSPGLIPKPADWGPEIDIAGFVFLDLASSFKPPETLVEFLEAGEPPVYIGFGSIVVDDPDKFTALIFEAVKKAGVRALVSKGWGGLGDEGNTPDNIYMLDNTPHDWLFPRVSAVVHHGGAGTTAIGLKCGKPTMIVPFFGDQPFWGAMVANAGAGAQQPVPYKHLSIDALAEGIMQCLSPEAQAAAEKIAADIAAEGDGARNAVRSFHSHLRLQGEKTMRCSILVDRVATWQVKKSPLRLSTLAAELLVEKKRLKWHDLRPIRHCDWNDFEGPGEPLTGGGAALLGTAGGVVKGIGSVPVRIARSIRRREKHSQEQEKKRQSSKAPTFNAQKPPSEASGILQTDKEKSLFHHKKHRVERHLEAKLRSLTTSKGDTGRLSNVDDDETLENTRANSRSNIAQDIAVDAGTGLAEMAEALAKAPMDLSLAIAQGFHNAPRLYGDSTVRTPIRVSGIQSGLKAAGSEFVFGIYDGVTGLWLQPYRGAKENGAVGFVQGVGKGFGGFILKDLAAIIGPFGYTLKGVHKELVKSKKQKLTHFIRTAKLLQGKQEFSALDEVTKRQVSDRIDAAWKIVTDIMLELEITRQKEGLAGRLALAREKRRLSKQGAFESVDTTRKAFAKWKHERAAAESKPARSTAAAAGDPLDPTAFVTASGGQQQQDDQCVQQRRKSTPWWRKRKSETSQSSPWQASDTTTISDGDNGNANANNGVVTNNTAPPPHAHVNGNGIIGGAPPNQGAGLKFDV